MGDKSSSVFLDAVRQHFGFLEAYGFRVAAQGENFIRYFSADISVEAFQEAGLGQISIELRSTWPDTEMLSLEDLCAYRSVERPPLHALSPAYIVRVVAWIAGFLRNSCDELLLGSLDAWSSATAAARRESIEYTNDLRLSSMRSALSSLWDARDYRSIIELMEPIEQYLTRSEIRKLAIARREDRRKQF